MMTKTTQPGAEPANVFEDRATPGQWRVEWFDDDGRCELEVFTGPDARRQALRYAMQKYGHFREAQLEQQGEAPRLHSCYLGTGYWVSALLGSEASAGAPLL